MSLQIISLAPAGDAGVRHRGSGAGAEVGCPFFPWYPPRGCIDRPQLLGDAHPDPGFVVCLEVATACSRVKSWPWPPRQTTSAFLFLQGSPSAWVGTEGSWSWLGYGSIYERKNRLSLPKLWGYAGFHYLGHFFIMLLLDFALKIMSLSNWIFTSF